MAGYTPLRAEQFLVCDENDKWSVHEDGVRLLEAITRPIYSVAIIGEYRTGKSFLLNQLLGQPAVFTKSAGRSAETTGIWIVAMQHPDDKDAYMIFLDTEGMYNPETVDEKDSQICSLAILLCNSLIVNVRSNVHRKHIQELGLLTESVKNMRAKTYSKIDTDHLKLQLPHLYFVIRDNTLEDDNILDRVLKYHNAGKDMEKANGERKSIKRFFEKIYCFTLQRPAAEEYLRNLPDSDHELNPKFQQKVEELRMKIFGTTRPMSNGTRWLNGGDYISLAKIYVEAINQGDKICFEESTMWLRKHRNRKAKDKALQLYHLEMEPHVETQSGRVISRSDLTHHSVQAFDKAVKEYQLTAHFEPDAETLLQLIDEIIEIHGKILEEERGHNRIKDFGDDDQMTRKQNEILQQLRSSLANDHEKERKAVKERYQRMMENKEEELEGDDSAPERMEEFKREAENEMKAVEQSLTEKFKQFLKYGWSVITDTIHSCILM